METDAAENCYAIRWDGMDGIFLVASESQSHTLRDMGSEITGWRREAARIVEELFGQVGPEDWDLLLDLRAGLLRGDDWGATLGIFMEARERLEEGHYLVLYRLRRMLAGSLRLELGAVPERAAMTWSLAEVLRARHRSFEDLERRMRREWFEHMVGPGADGDVALRVIELGGAGS